MNGRAEDADRRSHLETRIDARFQAVAARFSTLDRRLGRIVDRLDEQDQRAAALTGRIDARLRSIDSRFDATDARADLLHEKLAAQLHQERHRCRRLLLATAAVSAAGWALTLSLLLTSR